MALQGSSREQQIWNKLFETYHNAYGVAALMGNIDAESGLNPKNLQNTFEKSLGYTDNSYTEAVDNGTYSNFVHDKAGYGLCQWTWWSRKQAMLEWHRARGKSIGDLETQLEFLIHELSTNYKSVHSALMSATSVKSASDAVLHKFEAPRDQSAAVEKKRASMGQVYYDKYAKIQASSKPSNDDVKGVNNMSNSSLVTCKVLSPNHSGRRTHAIDTITPHCVVGQLSASGIGSCFPSGRGASCNYGIGTAGDVVLVVDEGNRSWCSSSNSNDQRAVTIECASDKSEPYAMNNKVYNKLIELCVDICRRNGKKKLLWLGSKDATLRYNPKSDEMVLTAHRWFANKSCPGNWLYSRYGDLANKVTAALRGSGSSAPAPSGEMYRVRKTWADSKSQKGAYTNLNNAKKCADQNPGYSVFNSKGHSVYAGKTSAPAKPAGFQAYQVRVDITDLRIRKGPGTNYGANGYTGRGTFTIVAESSGKGASKWGKLKSGAGWISLDYARRV